MDIEVNMNTQRTLSRDDALLIRHLAEHMPALPNADEIADTLLDLVAQAEVVDEEPWATHVGMGSQVTFTTRGVAGEQTVTVVAPADADARAGRVSLFTPVGMALIGLPIGAEGTLRLPNGQTRDIHVRATQAGLLPAA